MSISSTKFPFPEPIPFPAHAAHEPVKAPQPGWYCWYQIKKRHQSQRSDPATFLIVSGEDWPTAIGRRAKCNRTDLSGNHCSV
jgi:hypothetical protein